MNLKQAIGSLLSVRLNGYMLDARTESALEDGTVGGVTLFRENARDLKQLIQLIAAIKSDSFHQLIISTDQEGGAVQRFDHLITPLPSAMALAATGDLGLVKLTAEISCRQLDLLGFNCVLAPVLDVLQNPINQVIATRSYGSRVDQVTQYAGQYLHVLNSSPMKAVGKHFPGHGSTIQDSHFEPAVNDSSIEEIWQNDLAPFKACLKDLPAILIGHVWLPAIDREPLPATLSPRIISDILRQYLQYDGLIMTDSFDMQAITDKWTVEKASLLAINAGVDHLLLCLEIEQLLSVHKYLLAAVESGKLTEERLLTSVRRTEKIFGHNERIKENVKTKGSIKTKGNVQTIDSTGTHDNAGTTDSSEIKHNLDEKNNVDICLATLAESIAESQAIVLQASTKAITILKGELPPINSGEWLVIKPNHARYPLRLAAHLNRCIGELNKAGQEEKTKLRFVELGYTLDPSDAEAEQIGKECAERNCIFLTFRSLINQGQFRLAEMIKENARQHLHIACDLPYDLIGLTEWQNCLATYDPSDLAMRALAEVLLGLVQPGGTCPVDLNLRVRIGEPEI